MSTTHINIRGKRRHDASVDCWCHPDVLTFHDHGSDAVVVDHRDGVHQTVAHDLALSGEMQHESAPHILGARRLS